MTAATRMIAWLTPAQTGFVSALADACGLTLVGAGSPIAGEGQAVAKALGVDPVTDLRSVLTESECELVLLATPGEFGADPSSKDAEAVANARDRGVRVATLEPIPGRALDLGSSRWIAQGAGPHPIDAVRFIPLARYTSPLRSLPDLLEQLGSIRSVAIESWSNDSEGSLGARLFSAMELVNWLLGEAETIDAAYVSPGHGSGVHMLPGDTVRDLHGDMTANLRFPDGRAASIATSDQAGRRDFRLTILAAGGRVTVSNDELEWVGPDGETIEKPEPHTPSKHGRAVDACAEALKRLLDPNTPADAPTDHGSIHAMMQAALLSARTGQGESPSTIRQLVAAR